MDSCCLFWVDLLTPTLVIAGVATTSALICISTITGVVRFFSVVRRLYRSNIE